MVRCCTNSIYYLGDIILCRVKILLSSICLMRLIYLSVKAIILLIYLPLHYCMKTLLYQSMRLLFDDIDNCKIYYCC